MSANMRRIHAMDIPELRNQLIPYLSRSDLAIASAVCKSWNLTFSPILYKSVKWTIAESKRGPKKESIRKNGDYIHTIRFHDDLCTGFPCEALTQLREIQVANTGWGFVSSDQLVVLLYRNPHLHTIYVDFGESMYIRCSDLLAALEYCKQLKHVNIPSLLISRKDVKLFLHFFSRLESLNIKEFDIPLTAHFYNWDIPFTNMKELSFNSVISSHTSWKRHLEIVKRCPQLTSLMLVAPIVQLNLFLSKVRETISTHVPHLKTLKFSSKSSSVTLTDFQFSKILYSRQNLSIIDIPRQFEMLSYEALKSNHFSTITTLSLGDDHAVTSKMIHECLTSCPLLIQIQSQFINARDILGVKMRTTEDGKEVFRPQKWACTGLKQFEILINGLMEKPIEWHEQILNHIGSNLQQLEVLDISDTFVVGSAFEDSLDFRLEYGLEKLETLKNLKSIGFTGTRQKLKEQDIRWMVKNWPQLECIVGNVHDDLSYEDRMKFMKSFNGLEHDSIHFQFNGQRCMHHDVDSNS
ncbi:hypothetical protein BGZ76_001324 [Entomortierella beljakovae]|nr:hypothetical protein BGZ76_001324 [Entomortierella beljakovae]